MHQIGMFVRHFVVVIEFFYIDYNTNFLKTLLFQNKKPFSGMPKGLELTSSPYWTRLELSA
jgi:hypothetical protein